MMINATLKTAASLTLRVGKTSGDDTSLTPRLLALCSARLRFHPRYYAMGKHARLRTCSQAQARARASTRLRCVSVRAHAKLLEMSS